MNSKERVAAAFDGRPADKTPICHISCSSAVASKLLGREAYIGFGIQAWREATALWNGPDAHAEFVERTYRDTFAVNEIFENDILRFDYGGHPRKPTKRLDEHTFLYEYGDEFEWQILRHDPDHEHINTVFPLHPKPPLELDDLEAHVEAAEKSLGDYRPTVAADDPRNFGVRARRELGDRFVIRTGGAGVNIPRDPAWLMAAALKPEVVGRHLDVRTEQSIRAARPKVELGFRYFFGGGDFAGNSGPMYSPKIFHELVLPRLQRLSEGFHAMGAKWLFASDGDLWPVAEDLFGASGVDGFYEIDGDCNMELPRLRERFPDLALVGNISSRRLHRGTRDDVIRQTLGCMEAAKKYKGIVVGVSNMIMPDSPIENVEAMIRTIHDNR